MRNTRHNRTIVAVLGFLQEFSSTALTKRFKTGLNQKKRAGICWNKPRNIKYFQISGAISLERLGTTTQPHARALVLSFCGTGRRERGRGNANTSSVPIRDAGFAGGKTF